MKKLLITLLKIVCSLAILGWLVYKALKFHDEQGRNVFVLLAQQVQHWDGKEWGLFAAALTAAVLVSTVAIMLTLIRWCYLVRALGIELPMRDALRIGLWGFLVNLAPMGIVGGDLLKAYMLAHEYPGYRAKSLASVVMDRIIGLYILFVVGSVGILVTGFYGQVQVAAIHLVCIAVLAVTGVGAVAIPILFLPGVVDGRWIEVFTRIPRVGHLIHSLVDAMRSYRHSPGTLLASCLMTVGVHGLLTVSVFLVALGLFEQHISLAKHFVIYPVSGVASTIPLPAGPFEAVLESMYKNTHASEGLTMPDGQGLIVALLYRLITVLQAAVAFGYCMRSRKEVAEVFREVEEDKPSGEEEALAARSAAS
ncbi:MAG: lysylphosphatidylglycerol synthase transmembrane domain-containing protein [Thermoguttaceae bacterium]